MPFHRTIAALGLACVALPAGAAPAALAPWCGGDDVDLGGAFRLRMYLFHRAPGFDLAWRVPAGDLRADGAIVATQPVEITFAGLRADQERVPRIGYAGLDLRDRDGLMLRVARLQLDCGGGVGLSSSFSWGTQPLPRAGPNSFDEPFFSDRAHIPACFAALKRDGRFTMRFYGADGGQPMLVLAGRIPVARGIARAGAFWRRELHRADRGQCRIMPSPPSPF